MNTPHKVIAGGAAGSMLALAALVGYAADPSNPDGSVQADQDVQQAETERRQEVNDPNRGWTEQVRDWWNSDQGEVKTITGTIIDLETYLINGEEAARQQNSSNASLYDNDPVALLTDDGDLYLLLDRYERRLSFSGADSVAAAPTSDPGVSGTNRAGVESNLDARSDRQMQLISAGQTMTLSGNAYDRGGVKGLLVHSYRIKGELSHVDDAYGADADDINAKDYPTPRPSDETQMGE